MNNDILTIDDLIVLCYYVVFLIMLFQFIRPLIAMGISDKLSNEKRRDNMIEIADKAATSILSWLVIFLVLSALVVLTHIF